MGATLRLIVAPDSFGGALDSVAVAQAIAAGWQRTRPDDEVVQAPMADGGEGTLAAVAAALGTRAQRRSVAAHDPLGRPIFADYLLLDDGRVAFIEMAAASGLAQLTDEERTPASASIASKPASRLSAAANRWRRSSRRASSRSMVSGRGMTVGISRARAR